MYCVQVMAVCLVLFYFTSGVPIFNHQYEANVLYPENEIRYNPEYNKMNNQHVYDLFKQTQSPVNDDISHNGDISQNGQERVQWFYPGLINKRILGTGPRRGKRSFNSERSVY